MRRRKTSVCSARPCQALSISATNPFLRTCVISTGDRRRRCVSAARGRKAIFTWITKTTEVAPGFHLILLNGTWGVDLEVKEISLAIDTPDGIVLVVGCSHPTIEKIVEAAKTAINKPIHLVLGGTHLLPAKDDQINSIAVSLRDNWSVRYLAPVHCTGEPAFAILKETFGDRYIYAGLGTTVLLGPKVTVKAEAGQPYKNAMDEEDLRSYREAMMRGPLRGLLGGDKRLTRVGQ